MKLKLTRVPGPPPVGVVFVCCREDTIVAVDFTQERLLRLLGRRFGAVELLPSRLYQEEFLAYLRGSLKALEALPHDGGGTPFQKQVWRSLREIPVGETRTYTEVAQRLGQPRAIRAVGLANALNPINLIVPCHRVIGRSGALTGYGGGLEVKAWLLEHEAKGSR
jgi:methylated-DNA-[protein]-cysteine S-methyltransferase